jgi:deoxyadenosine/deoxycytidine kinase
MHFTTLSLYIGCFRFVFLREKNVKPCCANFLDASGRRICLLHLANRVITRRRPIKRTDRSTDEFNQMGGSMISKMRRCSDDDDGAWAIVPTHETRELPGRDSDPPSGSAGSPTTMCAVADLVRGLTGLVVAVEENIGCGKSTLTRALHDVDQETVARGVLNGEVSSQVSVFPEQMNDLFLSSFYEYPAAYAFAFQMYTLTTRIHELNEAWRQSRHGKSGDVVFPGDTSCAAAARLSVLDRGPVGDSIFASLCHKNKHMSDREFDIYKSVCRDRLPQSIGGKVDMLVYLDVDPGECHRRVTTLRKTSAEVGMPLSYLQDVDSCYFHAIIG